MKNLTKPVNFRDLGGLKGKDGRRIRPFSILRSGELVKLSVKDREILAKEYQLKTIVDLRGEKEYSVNPDDDILGTVYHNIDILKKIHETGADLGSLESVRDVHGANFHMNSLYEQMVSNEGAQRGFREFLELLLKQREGAFLFHCFAGKDRTGLAAAIILTILDVSKDDIFTDYLKTNELRREENLRLLGKLKNQGLSDEQCSIVEIALTVNEEYLKTAYQAAEKQYGSFSGYITRALKVTKEEEEELQRRYLIER
ncbi:tyrosine-protein phosphatase [Anaerocolumna xylanovorans]|uniref:Protein-tyrosine phosphatase n=1 Tax=Anaerocolumna xylanovorans DSM 12503 TaxID=1121345 RepID=A0A1M7Y7S0_9FIRM|nr:tyrosine-protein phosphatase [Anaerocolumna xylanovorans]SHO48667.1 protein-tyrosine phosphatase [Anaerocolumna xylanovorans DSM 12503]